MRPGSRRRRTKLERPSQPAERLPSIRRAAESHAASRPARRRVPGSNRERRGPRNCGRTADRARGFRVVARLVRRSKLRSSERNLLMFHSNALAGTISRNFIVTPTARLLNGFGVPGSPNCLDSRPALVAASATVKLDSAKLSTGVLCRRRAEGGSCSPWFRTQGGSAAADQTFG